MAGKILALGFRADATVLQGDLERTVAKYNLGVRVFTMRCKSSVMDHLDKKDTPLDDKEFVVNLGYPTSEREKFPQYLSYDTKLFVCSTVTREDTDEHSSALSDGEEFAKLLMPETPKLILHFKNEYRGDLTLPSAKKLELDFGEQLYHLPRESREGQINPSSINAMDRLVKELFEKDMKIPFELYLNIIDSAR
ncbi:hypothetical protein KY339_05485 [Candidatus Woesearchaeota archaeon]|nr:hypothetical protein [Candidatus Woesearchaeota archaeon]